MENKLPNLKLERTQKLKAFAMCSAKKGTHFDIIKKGDIAIMIAFTYTEAEAIQGAIKGLIAAGANPQEYNLKFLITSVDMDAVLPHLKTQTSPQPVTPINAETKTTEEFVVENIRRAFKLVGTESEIKISEEVIEKFKLYAGEHKI